VPPTEAPVFAEIALPLPVGQTLTYRFTSRQAALASLGARVRVPVGRRSMTGFLVGLADAAPDGVEARAVDRLIDRSPALTGELLELARFAANYYLAPLGDLLAAMIPTEAAGWGESRLRLTDAGALALPREALEGDLQRALMERGRIRLSELEELLDVPSLGALVERLEREGKIAVDSPGGRGGRFVTAVELAPGDPAAWRDRCGRSAAGRGVVDFLATLGRPALAREVTSAVGCGESVIRRLVALGVLRRFSQPERLGLDRHFLAADGEDRPSIVLRSDQSTAVERLGAAVNGRGFSTFLLHGITGSGKTEVYLAAAEAALAAGRSVLLLVPEIALVPALATQAAARFGDRLAVLHSGLGTGERMQEWERIRRGEARLVVGPRSAVFAPVEDLGLIVVDEEQDLAYKQDTAPRYHGRDLAVVRCRTAGAVALLVSATPSLEVRRGVADGRIAALRLTCRAGAGTLPEGILVDLRTEPRDLKVGEVVFSRRLREEIERALAAEDQVILLRNRRGYAPLLLCRACGEDFRCADCGLPRTYHRRAGHLLCHYCGSALPAPPRCPACRGETLEAIGAGTERVEEGLRELFPGVAIDVLDRDSARRSGGPAAILERFQAGATRILVGTQMISKGHHFPRVALTAVLSADSYLGFPDFRAVEKTFALLTQLGGRAGRGDRPGRVVIQSYLPDHYAIRAALTQDDEGFVEQEMRFRRLFHYPPFTRMVQLLLRDRQRERGMTRLEEIARRLRAQPRASELRLTGPAPAPLERLRGEWRLQCLVRAEDGAMLRRAVREAVGERPVPGLAIDVDPYQLL